MHQIEVKILQLQSVKRFSQTCLHIFRMMTSVPQLNATSAAARYSSLLLPPLSTETLCPISYFTLFWSNCIGLSRYIAITNLSIIAIAVFVEYLRQFLLALNQIYRHSSVSKNTSQAVSEHGAAATFFVMLCLSRCSESLDCLTLVLQFQKWFQQLGHMLQKCPCPSTNPLTQTVYPLLGGKVHPNFENKKKIRKKFSFSLHYDKKNALNPLVKSVFKSVVN